MIVVELAIVLLAICLGARLGSIGLAAGWSAGCSRAPFPSM